MTVKTKKKEAKKEPKVAVKAVVKPKVAAPPKVVLYVIPDKTRNSAALKSLKWKLPANRTPGKCCRKSCGKTGIKGLFCKKDKKILRKRQLKLNNIPWRKKKAKKDYVPDQPHLIYGGKATEFALKDREAAVKVIKAGKTTLLTVKQLDDAIAKAKLGSVSKKVAKADKAKKHVPITKKESKLLKRVFMTETPVRASAVVTKPKKRVAKTLEVFVKIPVSVAGVLPPGAEKVADMTHPLNAGPQ